MAVGVFRSMALEIPSGPDDVFLGMEDSRWRTSSLEQEMFESSGGGGVGSGGLYHLSEIELASKVLHRQETRVILGVADRRLMLKSPSKRVELSLVGWMSERAASKSSIIDTGADGG